MRAVRAESDGIGIIHAMKRLHAQVYGVVQGVGYRMFAQGEAIRLGLRGYVRNCSDGSVEVVAEGMEEQLQAFLERLWQGPLGARVHSIDTFWDAATGEFEGFTIRR